VHAQGELGCVARRSAESWSSAAENLWKGGKVAKKPAGKETKKKPKPEPEPDND
jgi:hypothetical protein